MCLNELSWKVHLTTIASNTPPSTTDSDSSGLLVSGRYRSQQDFTECITLQTQWNANFYMWMDFLHPCPYISWLNGIACTGAHVVCHETFATPLKGFSLTAEHRNTVDVCLELKSAFLCVSWDAWSMFWIVTLHPNQLTRLWFTHSTRLFGEKGNALARAQTNMR